MIRISHHAHCYLVKTIAALEALKDEKISLSSSLEMHVELTLQLQQEVDNLKTELVSGLELAQFVGGKRFDKRWI